MANLVQLQTIWEKEEEEKAANKRGSKQTNHTFLFISVNKASVCGTVVLKTVTFCTQAAALTAEKCDKAQTALESLRRH